MAENALETATLEVEAQREVYYYWPESYASAEYLDEDEEKLKGVDYEDIAYDKWNIELSLRAKGVAQEYWHLYLNLREGAEEIRVEGQEVRYLTLLYRVPTSNRLHAQYDKNLVNLYTGYVREIIEKYGVDIQVSYYLIRCLGGLGSWYISGLLYHYKRLLLDVDGYFWYTSGNNDTPTDDEEEE